jgi:hypothetical protein
MTIIMRLFKSSGGSLSVVGHIVHRGILAKLWLWLRVEALGSIVTLVGCLCVGESVASLIGCGAVILISILRYVTVNSKVHQFLNCLFSLRCQMLLDVIRVVEYLSVIGEDLTHVFEVNLDYVALR